MHSFAQDIYHAGDSVIINANQHNTRVVSLTRREHLPPGIRLWNGDPIGRWDGDTLVVGEHELQRQDQDGDRW